MAGIYLHIPFCKRACTYCDFHFVTHLNEKQRFLNALDIEIQLQPQFLPPGAVIDTVYFGGGTPSLLSEPELTGILKALHNNFKLGSEPEITLECNPDDLTLENARAFRQAGINRLSIGIQSFHQEHLKQMNRSHNAHQAISGIENAKHAGFENITVDLIYGLPQLSLKQWEQNLETFNTFQIPHLSAYNLTVEPGTPLAHAVKKKRVSIPDDDFVLQQFNLLMDYMERAGYEHYEISNFAKPGRRSIHNTNYWMGIPFAGMGPGAHSFDGNHRFYNPPHNKRYLEKLESDDLALVKDSLTKTDKINELIMIRLRMAEGLPLEKVNALYGKDEELRIAKTAEGFLQSEHLVLTEKKELQLTRKGKYLADYITAELFKD